MLKKILFSLSLAVCGILPLKAESALAQPECDVLARVNWNININTFGGCGPCGPYGPCCPFYGYPYPYLYPYAPPCAYPFPSPYWYW